VICLKILQQELSDEHTESYHQDTACIVPITTSIIDITIAKILYDALIINLNGFFSIDGKNHSGTSLFKALSPDASNSFVSWTESL